MLHDITPLILTFNEAPNIARTLDALHWAKEVVVIDSYSTDETLTICQRFANVRVIQNEFRSASEQCNFGLAQQISSTWVLSLDADYVVSDELHRELRELQPSDTIKGFEISFDYLIDGHKLYGSLYPARTCLYRRENAFYVQDGHTQRVVIDGLVSKLKGHLYHDDRKPFSRWRQSQIRYANLEAQKFSETSFTELSWVNRIRFFGLGPLFVVPYTLLLKGVIRSGTAGLKYTAQRVLAEIYLIAGRIKYLKFRINPKSE